MFAVVSVVRRCLFFVCLASFVNVSMMMVSECLKLNVVVLLSSSVNVLLRMAFIVAVRVNVLKSLMVWVL